MLHFDGSTLLHWPKAIGKARMKNIVISGASNLGVAWAEDCVEILLADFGTGAWSELTKRAASSRRHPAQLFPDGEKVFQVTVVTHDAVNDPPPTAYNLSWQ